MKIGLISDIHGNLQALTQVLAALDAAGVDMILCAGDLVCYGANPNEVMALLRGRGVACVAGNYDTAVAWNLPKASRKPSSPRNEPLKQAALDWTKKQVDAVHLSYLRGLPFTALHEVDGLRVRLLHAGPTYLDEWVSPDEPESLTAVTQTLPADVIVLGHTHQPFVAKSNGTLFINPGAVGRSLDGDPRASYAILETDFSGVTMYREAYDVATAVAAIKQTDMPSEIGDLVYHAVRRIEQLQIVKRDA
jgi:putative phosphoesterase